MFNLNFKNEEPFLLTFGGEEQLNLTMTERIIVPVYTDPYEGDYEVVPRAYENVELQTEQKQMKHNVTVYKVPKYETHNEHGSTVYIATDGGLSYGNQ